jgi:hypothetical protein
MLLNVCIIQNKISVIFISSFCKRLYFKILHQTIAGFQSSPQVLHEHFARMAFLFLSCNATKNYVRMYIRLMIINHHKFNYLVLGGFSFVYSLLRLDGISCLITRGLIKSYWLILLSIATCCSSCHDEFRRFICREL